MIVCEVDGAVIFVGIPLQKGQDTCSKGKQTQHDGDGEVAMAVLCFTAL
jgi:hypothetical protein